MPLNIKNAKDMQPQRVHLWLMGDMGTAKTTIANTFPDPLFIQPVVENSILTLKGLDVNYTLIGETDHMGKRTKPPMQEMQGIIDELLVIQKRDGKAKLPCETLVMENFSGYCDMVVEQITEESKAKEMSQREWGIMLTHALGLQSALRQLDVHVVWISHISKKFDDRTKTLKYAGASVSGAAGGKLPANCDAVGYTTVRQGKPPIFTTYFTKRDDFPARTRFHSMPTEIQNFAWKDIAPHAGWPL